MGDSFAAEGDADHTVEDVTVKIYRDSVFIAELILPPTETTLLAREIKMTILKLYPNFSNPDECDLLYVDDTTRIILPDNKDVSDYEVRLCGEMSLLELRCPRNANPPQPQQNPGNFGVTLKK